MPWVVGIDEAGYGPNLGPLVMTSVACRVPEELAERDLWGVLESAVRRHDQPADGRLLVEDSKLVYSSQRGLHDLETGVFATLSPWHPAQVVSLAEYLDWLCPAAHEDLYAELWYSGHTSLPAVAGAGDFRRAAARFDQACGERGIVWGTVRSVVISAASFNQLLDAWGSKGAVLGHGLRELLAWNCGPGGDGEPVLVSVDKHGGRNNYAAMVQEALPDGLVLAEQEGMQRSVYRVLGLGREVRLVFQPRADAEHFCVALASMVSKYLREVLMREFNDFWRRFLPGLKPTAGYPGDAARYFDEILPVVKRLGIPVDSLWRRK